MQENSFSIQEIIDVVPYSLLLVDHGQIAGFNKAAGSTFGLTEGKPTTIRRLWPEFGDRETTGVEELIVPGHEHAVLASVNINRISGEKFMVMIRDGSNQSLMLEPQVGFGSTAWLQEKLEKMVDIIHHLASCDSVSDMYRETVIMAREQLDIDRIGILLFDREKETIRGTWGTGSDGSLVDESNYEAPIGDEEWVKDAFRSRAHSVFHDDFTLRNYGKPVGKGWNAMINLWQGDRIIGWIAADNLIQKRPLTPAVRELLRQLGANLSQLISHREREDARLQYQQNLEIRLRETKEKLDKQYKELILANRQLSDRNSMDTLGETIAGIAHELNTPIGSGVTAASGISQQTERTRAAFDEGRLNTAGFTEYLDYTEQASRILETSLHQAARLIKAFRKTAIDQLSDQAMEINLKSLLETIVLSLSYLLKRREVKVIFEAPSDLVFKGYPGLITQVAINLITNSLKHGFPNDRIGGVIGIGAEEDEHHINIRFSDNGIGIPENLHEKVFESFFTTQRDKGGSGLGLYLVRDIVRNKLGGTVSVESTPNKGTTFRIRIPK